MKNAIRNFIFDWSGYSRVRSIEEGDPSQTGDQFLKNCIREFAVESQCKAPFLEPMPKTVFVCTHHSGALDILSIYPHLKAVSCDLKIVVNKKLLVLKSLTSQFIPVYPPSWKEDNSKAMTEISAHLIRGGNILIYPAGKIGNRVGRKIVDSEWRHGSAKTIQENAERIIPIFVDARNSGFFYFVRRAFPRLSLLFILRELANRELKPVSVYFGQPIEKDEFKNLNPQDLMKLVRNRTYQLKEVQQ